MAIYYWASTFGNWNVAANWETLVDGEYVSGVPGAGDTADITGDGNASIKVTAAIAAGEIIFDGYSDLDNFFSYATLSLGVNLSYAGIFDAEIGDLDLDGHTLTLTGDSNDLAWDILGKGKVKVTGAAIVAPAPDGNGLIVAGGAILEDAGSMTQEGGLYLYLSGYANGELLIDKGATYTITDVGLNYASIDGGKLVNDGTLTIDTGAELVIEVSGDGTLGGVIGGGGTLWIGETVTLSTTKFTVGALDVYGSALNLGVSLTYAGVYSESDGRDGVLALGGHWLTLSGASNTLNGTIEGGGKLKVTGAATVGLISDYDFFYGETTVTGTTLEDAGAMTQEGSLFLGLEGETAGELLIDKGATYTIADDGGSFAEIYGGAFVNNGTLTIDAGQGLIFTGSNGVDTLGSPLGGTIDGAGTLEIEDVQTITTSHLTVAAIDIDGGDLTLDAYVASSETFYFSNDGKLVLDDLSIGGLSEFHGAISGFAAGDSFDALGFGTGTTFKFSEKKGGASGTLTLTDGTLSASIAFLGDYTKADFNAKVSTTATSFSFS